MTRVVGFLTCVLCVMACIDIEPTGPAEGMGIVSGNNQIGVVGKELPLPLVVRLNNEFGEPAERDRVYFTVTSGGGSVSIGYLVADFNGVVRKRWTLGPSASDSQRVEVTVTNQNGKVLTPVVFRATAVPDAP